MLFLKILYGFMGLTSLANGLWMLWNPEGWYENIPAAVPDTGAFNPHFIRDIGLAYTISGVGFIWAFYNLSRCRIVHIGQTLFIGGHAGLHIIDIVLGRLPIDHWWIDAPGVLLPGLIMAVLCVPSVWKRVNPEAGQDPGSDKEKTG